MRSMKKSVFAVCVALMLSCMLAVSAAAIDTPWLPIAPDGTNETEAATTTQDTTDQPAPPSSGETGEQNTTGGEVTDQSQNGTDEPQASVGGVTSSEQNETTKNPTSEKETQAPMSSEPKNGGCGGAVRGYHWIAVAICAAWILCKTKRAEKKEVNEWN